MPGTSARFDITTIARDFGADVPRSVVERAGWLPALALGCARGADMHAPTERIERASIGLGVKQVARVVRRLLVEESGIERTPDGKATAKEGR